MATKRGLRTRRRLFHKKKRQVTRRYRRPPPTPMNSLSLSNSNNAAGNGFYSPVSSPGASNTNNKNNKNNSTTTNSELAARAKLLAKLYPNLRGMLDRSTSFGSSNNLLNNKGWAQLEAELGTENEPYYPERRMR